MDEERRRRLLLALARWSWTCLVASVAIAALVTVASLADWWDAAVMCLLGLIAGSAAVYGLAGAREHPHAAFFAALALGMVVLPSFAAFLSAVAASDASAFAMWNTRLTPFVTFALVATGSGMLITRIWRGAATEEEAATEGPTDMDEWQAAVSGARADDDRPPPVESGAGEGGVIAHG